MSTLHKQFYDEYNSYIESLGCEPTLQEAMKYSFNSNGKLFRPSLFWAMLKDLGVNDLYFEVAIAIEMIHTYSLVHDDLPAMDNDDYRRGKLTCHKVFGEDIAILTGDALLTQAFDILTRAQVSEVLLAKLLVSFTSAAGVSGMIGGQVMDVKNENDPNLKLETLEIIHDKKTALMIELPIKCAQILADVSDDKCLDAARKLGLFYQVQDDYLDMYGNFEKMGKAVHADADKVTYSTLFKKSQLETYIKQLADEILVTYDQYPNTKSLVTTIVKREG